MNLLADEGVDRHIVEKLRHDGHDVAYIAEMDPGIADDLILSQANASGALLLTADKDFGELVYRQLLIHGGVLLIRLAGLRPETKANMIAQAIAVRGAEMAEAFSVISPGALRIRRQHP